MTDKSSGNTFFAQWSLKLTDVLDCVVVEFEVGDPGISGTKGGISCDKTGDKGTDGGNRVLGRVRSYDRRCLGPCPRIGLPCSAVILSGESGESNVVVANREGRWLICLARRTLISPRRVTRKERSEGLLC